MPALISRGADVSVGPVVFDVDVSVARERRATLSQTRLADGTPVSEHAQVEPDRFTVVLARSNIPQLSDALSGNPGQALVSAGAATLDNLVGTSLNTRRKDTERDFLALVAALGEVEVVTSEGTVVIFVEQVSALNDFGTFDAYLPSFSGVEVQRASTNRIDVPTDLSESLSGSGATTSKGPSRLGSPVDVTFGA